MQRSRLFTTWCSCLEVDVRRSTVNGILATIPHDRTVLENNDQAVYANGGVDFTNKGLAATLRVSDWSKAQRGYLCSTFLEEDKQRKIAQQLEDHHW